MTSSTPLETPRGSPQVTGAHSHNKSYSRNVEAQHRHHEPHSALVRGSKKSISTPAVLYPKNKGISSRGHEIVAVPLPNSQLAPQRTRVCAEDLSAEALRKEKN